MEPVKGNDKFNGVFDFFEWSAPYYSSPKEVVKALNSIRFKGKKVTQINVIGFVGNVGKSGGSSLYQKIRDAGIEPEDNWFVTYPYIDRIMVPWTAKACEPIQFVFEDNSTLEILPTEEGGARIGVNTIPIGLTEGLNHSNFNANCFFNEAIGREITSIEMCVERLTTQYIHSYNLDREKPYEETQHEYRFCIDFEDTFKMELVQACESWYIIKMEGSEGPGWDFQVPYSRVKEATIETEQVCIVNGGDNGGIFWIIPISQDGSKRFFVDNYGISIEDYYVLYYLGKFLCQYFDPDIQEDTGEYGDDGKRRFDCFGGNLYTFDSMRKILQEISTTISILENDYDNPSIDFLKKHLPWHQFTSKRKDELSDAEINELRKKGVPVVVDFYRRFIKRIEAMMRIPGRDIMSFYGP